MIKAEEKLKKRNMKAVRRRRGVYSYNSPPKGNFGSYFDNFDI
jgi:hypothetical protein